VHARAGAARHVGAAVVETCQRIETYRTGPCDCDAPVKLEGFEAIVHLAEVSAGLHSGALGEPQVVGQVRRGFAGAPAALRQAADLALASARELRREAHFTADSGALLARAMETAGVTPSGRLLVLGTGTLGRLVAAHGRALGFAEVIIAGRRAPEGEWLVRHGIAFRRLANIPSLSSVSVVAGCLGGDAQPLSPADLPPVSRLLVDLGTPRNFAQGFDLPLVSIADIIEHSASDHRRLELRRRVRVLADRRAAESRRDGRSALGSWRREVEAVRLGEVDRIRRLHPELPGETIDTITRGLVNKIFHAPLERLRDSDDECFTQRVASLFQRSEVPSR